MDEVFHERIGTKPISNQIIDYKEITLFFKQLANLLESHLPLVSSLITIIEATDNQKLKHLLMAVSNQVSDGIPFAKAIAQYPLLFDKFECKLLSIGEQSGTLDSSLKEICRRREVYWQTRQKLQKAMMYPALTLFMQMGLLALMMIYVIPQLTYIYSGMGADLPLATQWVITLSNFLMEYWWVILLFFMVVYYGVSLLQRKSEKVRYFRDVALLSFPGVKDVIQAIAGMRFAQVMSMQLQAGIPILNAVKASIGSAGNQIYDKKLLMVAKDIAGGIDLSLALRKTELFPSMLLQMVETGEQTGNLGEAMQYVAENTVNETDAKIEKFMSTVEVLILVILSIVVGIVIIAMYLPIFHLGSVI